MGSFMWTTAKKMLMPARKPEDLPATGLVPQAVAFQDSDIVQFHPTKHGVTQLESDRTLDALLGGQFGAAVVMVYAEWCSHCRNMMEAFETAAKSAKVPFVRIPGSSAPISSKKHDVRGYPTVFGVSSTNYQNVAPRKYNGLRTAEGLLEFASFLVPQAAEQQLLLPSSAPQDNVTQPHVIAPHAPYVAQALNTQLTHHVPQVPQVPLVTEPKVGIDVVVPSIVQSVVQSVVA